jgi:hypothetical protein
MHRDVWQENNLEQRKKSREPKSQKKLTKTGNKNFWWPDSALFWI